MTQAWLGDHGHVLPMVRGVLACGQKASGSIHPLFYWGQGGGGLLRAKCGMAKFRTGKIWHQFLTTLGNFGTTFLDGGTNKRRQRRKMATALKTPWHTLPQIFFVVPIVPFQISPSPTPPTPTPGRWHLH